MHDFREISLLMERTIHKYVQLEKQPRMYGGFVLTQTEVHTIAVVGDYPNINVTRLAEMRGITKGAASQMVYKLVSKGFIQKNTSPNSDSEVCLTLTENGLKVHEDHERYHEQSGSDFFQDFASLSEEDDKRMMKMLHKFDEALDKKLK